jgi:hypothetical protein
MATKTLPALLALVCAPLAAATFTFSDPNCSDFIYSGGVLTCVTSGPTPPDPTPPNPKPPDPTPPAGMANCTNQGMATMTTQPIQVTWGAAGQWFTRSYGSFGLAVWVFTVTVPPGTQPTSIAGRFTISEYGGQPTSRQISVSTLPCDFNPATALNISSMGATAETYWGVGAPASYWAGMAPGMTYYISMRNWGQAWPDPPAPSCTTNCPALMSEQPAQ